MYLSLSTSLFHALIRLISPLCLARQAMYDRLFAWVYTRLNSFIAADKNTVRAGAARETMKEGGDKEEKREMM